MSSETVTTTTDTGEPPPGLVTRVFSFGYGHVCPFTGEPLIDKHAVVMAPTAAQCRDLMIAAFGVQWSMEYTSLAAATRGGEFPSTEYARLVLPVPAATTYGRDLDNGDAPIPLQPGVFGESEGAPAGRAVPYGCDGDPCTRLHHHGPASSFASSGGCE